MVMVRVWAMVRIYGQGYGRGYSLGLRLALLGLGDG